MIKSNIKEKLTFGDIYDYVIKNYPNVSKIINDWRPIGPCHIQLWLMDGRIFHFNYKTKELYEGKDIYLKEHY